MANCAFEQNKHKYFWVIIIITFNILGLLFVLLQLFPFLGCIFLFYLFTQVHLNSFTNLTNWRITWLIDLL